MVANLSRFVAVRRAGPVGLPGHGARSSCSAGVEFPPIGELPYLLTLGPHGFYWFALEPRPARLESLATAEGGDHLPTFTFRGKWNNFFETGGKEALEALLPDYLHESRWFGGKARRMKQVTVEEVVPLNVDSMLAYVTLLRVEYSDGDPETYLLPLSATADERVIEGILRERPKSLIARLEPREGQRRLVLYDAVSRKGVRRGAASGDRTAADDARRPWRTGCPVGAVLPRRTRLRAWRNWSRRRMRAEQSNTSIIFGDRLILKLFRRLEEGSIPTWRSGSS